MNDYENKETRQENYFVHADLSVTKDLIVRDVPCKIFIPELITDKPSLEFQPTNDQFNQLHIQPFCGFYAEIKEHDGTLRTTFESPIVNFQSIETNFWGANLGTNRIIGEPQDLRITSLKMGFDTASQSSKVVWRITPNKMLEPPLERHTSFNGNVKIRRLFRHKFLLEPGFTVLFDNYYRYQPRNNEIVQSPYLVGLSTLLPGSEKGNTLFEQYLPVMDDFLLITSMAARTLTGCTGWRSYGEGGSTEFYRGHYRVPSGKPGFSLKQGFVSHADFHTFVRQSFRKFRKYPNRDSLRNAIYVLVPDRDVPLEQAFVAIFAALEMIVLDYRKHTDLENIMTTKEWNKLRDGLKKQIKTMTHHSLNDERRRWINSKLSELNRVPFRVAFDSFCRKYQIDLDDLWPVFSENREFTLSKVRNALVHGGEFPHENLEMLWTAKENLRWCLERIIARLFDWPIEKTDVNASTLADLSRLYQARDSHRIALEKWVNERQRQE